MLWIIYKLWWEKVRFVESNKSHVLALFIKYQNIGADTYVGRDAHNIIYIIALGVIVYY